MDILQAYKPFCSLQDHNPFSMTSSHSLCHFPECEMFEAWVKELHPPQRHRTPPKLKVVWLGQGRHRFKVSSRLDMVGTIPPPLSVKIRSRFWSYQIFGVLEERFSSLCAICFFAGMILWRLINFRLPAPFLQRCQPEVGLSAPFLLRR